MKPGEKFELYCYEYLKNFYQSPNIVFLSRRWYGLNQI